MTEKTAFIRRVQFQDTCSQLPMVKPWSGETAQPDIFICALGFEDRAGAIASAISVALGNAPKGATQCLLCIYSTNHEDNIRNSPQLRESIGGFCSATHEVSADSPQVVRKALVDLVAKASEPKKVRVTFDISVASGSLILSVLKTIIELRERVELTVLYCEPQTYFPEKAIYDSRPEALVEGACAAGDGQSLAEYGVADVEFNELYPGHNVESRPERVIAVPAFRTSRLVRCLAHISDQLLASPADSIFWVVSEPPASELRWRRDLQERIVNFQLAKFVGMSPADNLAPRLTPTNHSVCSTRDYTEILQLILTQADAHAGSNLYLVHMGSKLQSVGVALALAVRSEIAVCSSRPIQFNPTRYSIGVGQKWKLDMSNLEKIIDGLSRVGSLELQTKLETSRDPHPSF